MPLLTTKLTDIKYTQVEGGHWNVLAVHSFEMPDGKQWDAVNGWRKQLTFPNRPCGPTKTVEFCGSSDEVYHPEHYSQWKMEPIEFIAINDLPWWLANVIKYTMRFNMKDGLQDLRKARSYLDMKIRQVEGLKRFWDQPVTTERRANGKS